MSSSNSISPSFRSRNQRPCRNIQNHGFCKFEGKGCEYNHELARKSLTSASPSSPSKSNISTVHSGFSGDSLRPPHTSNSQQFSSNIEPEPPIQGNYHLDVSGNLVGSYSLSHPNNQGQNTNHQDRYYNTDTSSAGYFYDPLQFHLASSPLPHVSTLSPSQRAMLAFFMSDRLHEELLYKNEAILRTHSDAGSSDLPFEVNNYHSLCYLDTREVLISKVFNMPCSVYKGINGVDGKFYTLYRIANFKLRNESSISVIEKWRKIKHSNIVSVKEAFTTKQFGDHSLVLVYDFHPLAVTLLARYYTRSHPDIPERVLWSYAVQLFSALRTIHSLGLACKILTPSKVLITGRNRLRINCLGLLDIVNFGNESSLGDLQKHDFKLLGQLLLQLATTNIFALNLEDSVLPQLAKLSPEFIDLIKLLLSERFTDKEFTTVETILSKRLWNEFNSAQFYNDVLESDLSRELENGRLVRLLCKLGMINERPEYEFDAGWSETGDRYFVKLFRDYTFHQVDENGRPSIDLAHVIQSLNKLDAGSPEKIMLMSRDEANCIITSFKDVKRCIESSFQELYLSAVRK